MGLPSSANTQTKAFPRFLPGMLQGQLPILFRHVLLVQDFNSTKHVFELHKLFLHHSRSPTDPDASTAHHIPALQEEKAQLDRLFALPQHATHQRNQPVQLWAFPHAK